MFYAIYLDFVHHHSLKLQAFSGEDGMSNFLYYLTNTQTYPQVQHAKQAIPTMDLNQHESLPVLAT